MLWLLAGAWACRQPADALDRAELILGTLREPARLDPAFSVHSSEQVLARLLFPDLTVFDDRGQVVPRLAHELPEVKTSTSGTLVRWRLREGLRWSDGHPAGPSDYRFAHSIEAKPESEAVNYGTAEKVLSMRTTGPDRFEVRWAPDYRGVFEPRVHSILPSHAYEAPLPNLQGKSQADLPSVGPYRLLAWDPGSRIRLEPNPFWPGPRPQIPNLEWRFFSGEDALETAILSGQIDAIGPQVGLSPARALRIVTQLKSSHSLVDVPGGQLLQIGLKIKHPWLSQVEHRRALSEAVDRRAIAQLAYGGLAEPAFGLFGPKHPLHRSKPPDELSSTLRSKPPGLRLGYASQSELSRRVAVIVQESLRTRGFAVVLDAKPLAVLFKLARRGEGPELVLLAYRTRPDWTGRAVLHSEGRLNFGAYRNLELDRRLDALRGLIDHEQWVAALKGVDREFQRDMPVIPLVFKRSVSIKPNRLEGWKPTGTSTPITWNAERWRWRKTD